MADVYEQNLAQKSTLTTSDFIRVVGSDNVSYKQLVSDVAEKIISSRYLAYGVTSIPSSADLNTYRTAGVYTCAGGSVAQTLSNCPTTSAFRLEVKQIINAERYVQILYVNYNIHPTLYWRTYNGSWSSWYAPALKEQVDDLINVRTWHSFDQTTKADLLAKIDADMNAIGQGAYFGYMGPTQTALLSLPSASCYVVGGSNSANYRYIRLIRVDGTAEYILSKQNGTWASSAIQMPTRAEIDQQNTKVMATFNAPTGTTNGNLGYVKAGKMVSFSGSMQVSATIANGTTIFSGLPIPFQALAGYRCMCSSTGTWYDCYINSDGTLRSSGSWTATGWYRFAGSYITN